MPEPHHCSVHAINGDIAAHGDCLLCVIRPQHAGLQPPTIMEIWKGRTQGAVHNRPVPGHDGYTPMIRVERMPVRIQAGGSMEAGAHCPAAGKDCDRCQFSLYDDTPVNRDLLLRLAALHNKRQEELRMFSCVGNCGIND